MHLHPAETVEVKPAEVIHPLPAGEARPFVVMRVQQRGTAHWWPSSCIISSVVPAGASIVTEGQPTTARAGEGQRRASLEVELEPPGILTGGLGCLRDLGIVGLWRAHGEVLGDRPLPLDAVLLDQRRR